MDIKVKQRDQTDCGAACLSSVARYYNHDISVAKFRLHSGTDKKGTSLLGMVTAAENFGFEAKGFKGTFESLFNIPLPAIAHLKVGDSLHHYVVISGITKKCIKVMDPSCGEFRILKHQDFKRDWTGVLMLLLPSPNFEPVRNGSRFRRFWSLLKPYKNIIVQALVGSLIYTILGLSTAVFIQKIVDYVIVDDKLEFLNLLSLFMVVILVLRLIISVMKNIFIMRTGQLIDCQLILGYYKHLLKMPQGFFDSMRVGEITSRVGDAVKIRVFINDLSINILVSIGMLVSSLALMFTYYWKLALIMMFAVPVYSLIYVITNRVNKRVQRKLMESSADLESQVLESLNAIHTIKHFSLENYANEKTESKLIVLMRTAYKSGLNSVFANTSSEFTSQLFVILLLSVGSGYVLSGHISAGELLSFYTLLGYFSTPIAAMIGMNKVVQDGLIASDRLFEILELKTCSRPVENQIDLSDTSFHNIRFRNVCFRYGNREDVFSRLNLEIPTGKMTAIVGENGCGKSSLVSLLLNIYPVNEGNIYFGVSPINYISNKSLKKHIAVVPQVTDLFSTSILINITIGEEEIEMDRVISICTQLGIIDFIEQLPQGFQTPVGDNGIILSGGYRQRLAIARALYRNPEILVLDEATSSLDPHAEQLVLDALDDFLALGKTVVFIAHTLKIIHKADKIVVLQSGSVEEEGTHTELLARRSAYYKLWIKNLPEDLLRPLYETA